MTVLSAPVASSQLRSRGTDAFVRQGFTSSSARPSWRPSSAPPSSWPRPSLRFRRASASALGRLHLLRLGFLLGQLGSLEALPAKSDLGDAHRGVCLPMSAQLLVLFLALVVENQNLRAAAFFDDWPTTRASDCWLFPPDLLRRKPPPQGTPPAPSVPVPTFSTRITSPGATRYCFPPARITAYIRLPPSNVV